LKRIYHGGVALGKPGCEPDEAPRHRSELAIARQRPEKRRYGGALAVTEIEFQLRTARALSGVSPARAIGFILCALGLTVDAACVSW
jgi:hypothetical protein